MYSGYFPGRGMIRKFKLLEKNIAVEPFLEEIAKNRPALELKTTGISAHQESIHIFLRGLEKTKHTENFYHGNILRTKKTDCYELFPYTTAWLEAFAHKQNATLERAFIAILKPHGKVRCHFDAGIYYASRGRNHVVLRSTGTKVLVENEQMVFNTGEVWWFNNRLYHEFSHDSDEERIHLIFDLRSKSALKRMLSRLVWGYLYLVHLVDGSSPKGSPPHRT